MKFLLTGSLGHVGLPLTKRLVNDGHDVTVISSNSDRIKTIEQLGAKAKIGDMLNEKFLTEALTGADGAYLMMSFAHADDTGTPEQISKKISQTYASAIKNSGIKNIVNLSSVGADQGPEVGMLHMYQNVEQALNAVPDINITHIRPTAMYYNLFSNITTIKQAGAIFENYPGDTINSFVAPEDIAEVVADRLEHPATGINVEYVASDELTGDQVAKTLGQAIGKEIKWVEIDDGQKLQSLLNIGISEELATGLTRMAAAHKLEHFYDDYRQNQPTLGQTKLKDFAESEFVKFYNR